MLQALRQAYDSWAPGPLQRQSEKDAPWEARTPDLEVNSLTLSPTELRKQLLGEGKLSV